MTTTLLQNLKLIYKNSFWIELGNLSYYSAILIKMLLQSSGWINIKLASRSGFRRTFRAVNKKERMQVLLQAIKRAHFIVKFSPELRNHQGIKFCGSPKALDKNWKQTVKAFLFSSPLPYSNDTFCALLFAAKQLWNKSGLDQRGLQTKFAKNLKCAIAWYFEFSFIFFVLLLHNSIYRPPALCAVISLFCRNYIT